MATNKTFKRFNGTEWEEYYFYAYDSAKLNGQTASYYSIATHTHGQITSDGKMGALSGVTVGNGDRILVSDSSANNLIERGITIGTSTTTWLTNAGTWTTPTAANVGALPITGGVMTGILYPQNNTSYTTGQARRIILSSANPTGGGNGDVWIKYTV